MFRSLLWPSSVCSRARIQASVHLLVSARKQVYLNARYGNITLIYECSTFVLPLTLIMCQGRIKCRQLNYNDYLTFTEGNIHHYYGNLLVKFNSIKPLRAFTSENKRFRSWTFELEILFRLTDQYCHAALRSSSSGAKADIYKLAMDTRYPQFHRNVLWKGLLHLKHPNSLNWGQRRCIVMCLK